MQLVGQLRMHVDAYVVVSYFQHPLIELVLQVGEEPHAQVVFVEHHLSDLFALVHDFLLSQILLKLGPQLHQFAILLGSEHFEG